MFDTVVVRCLDCRHPFEAQTKSGDCCLSRYRLSDAPPDVLVGVSDIPFTCPKCGLRFKVKIKRIEARVVRIRGLAAEEDPRV